MWSKGRVLSIGVTALLISGLPLSACTPKEPSPAPSPTEPSPGETATSVPTSEEPTPTPHRPDTPFLTKEEGRLFQDDLGDGVADGWALKNGWRVVWEDSNYVLEGQDADAIAFPIASIAGGWSDYTVEVMVKVVAGEVNFNFLLESNKSGTTEQNYAVGTNSTFR